MCTVCFIYLEWLTVPLHKSSQCLPFINFLRKNSERTPLRQHSNISVWVTMALSASSRSWKAWSKMTHDGDIFLKKKKKHLRRAYSNLRHNHVKPKDSPTGQMWQPVIDPIITMKESFTCAHIGVRMAQMRRQRASEFRFAAQLPQIETFQDFAVAAAANSHDAFLQEFKYAWKEKAKQMRIRINLLKEMSHVSFCFSICWAWLDCPPGMHGLEELIWWTRTFPKALTNGRTSNWSGCRHTANLHTIDTATLNAIFSCENNRVLCVLFFPLYNKYVDKTDCLPSRNWSRAWFV